MSECRNPNHALVDGSPSPHEIGPSCMAEPESLEELKRQRDEFKESAYRLENTLRLLRNEAGLIEYWKSRAETAELKVLTFHETIFKMGAESVSEIWRCDSCGWLYNERSPLEDCDCKCTSFSFIGHLKALE